MTPNHVKNDRKQYRAENGRKQCKMCKQIKDVNEFDKDKKNYDGYRTFCKMCRSIQRKIYKIKNLGFYRSKHRLRHIFNKHLTKKQCEELLGCSMTFLEKHLDNLLEEKGFNREDQNWHIDHIIPFQTIIKDLVLESEDRDELYNCNKEVLKPIAHWENIQILSIEEHQQKSKEQKEYRHPY